MNNMLQARLLGDLPSRKWVDEIPGIMLTLNTMVHEPHGFSASMIATGREPTLPPDLEGDACASPSLEDPAAYVDIVKQRLALTHRQMTPPPAPVAINLYHEGNLIFVMTTPPEHSSKLAPRWKGPFFIKRVPNAYQVTYEDDMVWWTVHINHVKPAKIPAEGFPIPMPAPEPLLPPTGYLPRSFQRRRPVIPPQPAAPVAEPTQPAAMPRAATPPPSRPTTRSSANQNSAPRSEPRSPATPGRTNENSRLGQPLRRSARLNPTALCIKSQPQAASAHSRAPLKMARTYPYSLQYRTCLGRLEDPCSFSSIYLEDLYSGQRTYIKHVQQLVNVLPKSLDPTFHFSLRAQVTPARHQRMRDSLRTALWWLLPKDGDFRRASNGLHYYLARQGRCVVLRGVNVTSPLHQSRLHWIHDLNPNQSHRVEPRKTVSRNNNTVQNSDSIPRNPLDPIPSASWYNSSYPVPSASPPRNSVHSHSRPVPRNNKENNSDNEVSASATRPSLPAPLSSIPTKKRRSRKRRLDRRTAEREVRNSSFIQDARWANQRAAVPAGVTQPLPETSDPTSARRTAVYPPSRNVGDSPTNENSPFQIGLESSKFPGLYKPAVPDPQQDTLTRTFRANSSGSGPSSPTRTFRANSSGSGPRAGTVYPLQPCGRHPDTHITVDAAFQRPDLPDPGSPVQSQEPPATRRRASRKPSRKHRRNRSTAVFRPAKRSPPRGHWCD